MIRESKVIWIMIWIIQKLDARITTQKRPAVLNCMQKYWRFFSIFFILSRKKIGLGIFSWLVSSGNYDPHAKKIWGFSGFCYLPNSIRLHFKTAGPFWFATSPGWRHLGYGPRYEYGILGRAFSALFSWDFPKKINVKDVHWKGK